MKTADAIRWFKTTFGGEITTEIAGTPFSVDMLTAIAMQETGYMWSVFVEKGLSLADTLRLCVSDTLDADSSSPRSAFPKRKADLLAVAGEW